MRFDREFITKGSNLSGKICMQEGIKLREKSLPNFSEESMQNGNRMNYGEG